MAASQPLALDAVAVAASAGTATFVFDPVPSQTTYTGTLSCSAAPATSQWTSVVGSSTGAKAGVGTAWGAWGGQSVFGPVQVRSGQVLAVTVTGLVGGTQYTLAWRGVAQEAATAEPLYPAANTSAQSAAIAGAGIGGSTVTATSFNIGSGLTVNANPGLPVNTLLRLWNWGIYTPVAGGAQPTKGMAVLFLGGGGAFSLEDAVGYAAPASARLAGVLFNSFYLTSVYNGTDQTVTAFLDYSVAV